MISPTLSHLYRHTELPWRPVTWYINETWKINNYMFKNYNIKFLNSLDVFSFQQLSFLIGVLTDYGKPVILVGENGCGKSSIINDRIRTVCSGEVAEVLSLSIPANRLVSC